MEKSVTQIPSRTELKAIVFCHPDLLSLTGEPISSSESLIDQLEPGTVPDLSQFQASIVNPLIQLSDVPTCFASSPVEELLPWHLQRGARELSDCVQYQFADGLIISAREIFYHKHSTYVPLRLLPLTNRIRPEVENNPWLHLLTGYEFPEWGGLRKAELALISVLINASSDSAIKLWITNSFERQEKRATTEITRTGVIQKQLSVWQLGSIQANGSTSKEKDSLLGDGQAVLSFSEVSHTHGGKILKNFELSSSEKALLFHPYFQSVETVTRFLYSILGKGQTFEEWLQQATLSKLNLNFPLQGHQIILDITRQLDHKLQMIGAPAIRRQSVKNLTSSQIETQFYISKEGQIKFCRRILHSDYSIVLWNLPQVTASWINGLNGGLGVTQQGEIKNIAQDRRGLKRDRDLKVLKHTGIFALILLQTSHFVLEGKTFEGVSVNNLDDFLKILFNKLGTLLHEVERRAGFIDLSPALSLEKLCSKNVTDLIRDFVISLMGMDQKDIEHIFTSSGEYQIEGGGKSALALLSSLLTQIALESRGQCFLKPRLNAFSEFLGKKETDTLFDLHTDLGGAENPTNQENSIQKYQASSNWLPPGQVLHSLLPLRQRGYSLFYNDLPLDEMESDDFKSVFNLNESTEASSEQSQTIDWFELHPKFFFKGVEVQSTSLERLAKEGILEFQGKIYLIQNKNLPSIKRLENFWAKIQSSHITDGKRKSADRFYKLPKSQTLEMLALRATGVEIKGGARWKRICEFYDSLDKKRQPLQLPNSLHAELKPYQTLGVQWLLDLYELGLGGILADDMGLGKTIQTLSFLETLRTTGEMGSTLILVPTSLTYNWISEAARFTPNLSTMIFQSKLKDQVNQFLSTNKHSAIICTYGLFTEHQEFFSKYRWNILIFDEAQNLKNITSKRTTASRQVSARFKLCLTGTPLENHLGEFYSLIDLVVSGSLGDLSTFREKFIAPDTLDKNEIKYLKLKSKPLVLRRTKKEILSELPPKMESTVKLPFEQKQERIYRDIALSWNEKVKSSILSDGEAKSQLLMLTALLRLRQACSDPGSIPNVKYDEEPPKVSVLMEALQEITESGESALVFTQFIHTFERIKKELKTNGIEAYSLHGGTSRPERERILKEFQESKNGSVLLMTLKTGGVGLNLVKASYVFHLEPWWNPAVENQATDRAHRIGQLRPVQVYRYLMRESVEEKIEILKDRKSAKFNALFSPAENETELSSGSSLLSQSDFEYLLG